MRVLQANRLVAAMVAALTGLVAAGCGAARSSPEPDRVVVQHLLVSFAGKLPGKAVVRTEAAARDLARDLLERARRGEDFDTLVRANTDDQHPGLYTMVDAGRVPAEGEYERKQMVRGFGDTSFHLKVGELGLCEFDPVASPFGYHVIKRVE